MGCSPVTDEAMRMPGVNEVLHVMGEAHDDEAWSLGKEDPERDDGPVLKDSTKGE